MASHPSSPSKAQTEVQRILPLVFGRHDKQSGAISNIFAEGTLGSLSREVPHASIEAAVLLMQGVGLDPHADPALYARLASRSVHGIVSEIMSVQCLLAHEAPDPRDVPMRAAEREANENSSDDEVELRNDDDEDLDLIQLGEEGEFSD